MWVKGTQMTAEHRAKLSAAGMGNKNSLGFHPSRETRVQMSIAHAGKSKGPCSLETRLKIAKAQMGKTPSLETRAKLSAAKMGNTNSLGWCPSPEHRAKIAAANWKGGRVITCKRFHAKRRALNFIPMNQPFSGCEGHHLNQSDVIYIPKELHRSVSHNVWTGRGMEKINALATGWLTEDWT